MLVLQQQPRGCVLPIATSMFTPRPSYPTHINTSRCPELGIPNFKLKSSNAKCLPEHYNIHNSVESTPSLRFYSPQTNQNSGPELIPLFKTGPLIVRDESHNFGWFEACKIFLNILEYCQSFLSFCFSFPVFSFPCFSAFHQNCYAASRVTYVCPPAPPTPTLDTGDSYTTSLQVALVLKRNPNNTSTASSTSSRASRAQ